MNLRELLGGLEQLQEIYATAGAKTPARDIAKVIALLAPHDGKTLEAFMTDVHAASAADAARKARAPAAVDDARVDHYVRCLAEAGSNQPAFEETLAALIADATIKLGEADA